MKYLTWFTCLVVMCALAPCGFAQNDVVREHDDAEGTKVSSWTNPRFAADGSKIRVTTKVESSESEEQSPSKGLTSAGGDVSVDEPKRAKMKKRFHHITSVFNNVADVKNFNDSWVDHRSLSDEEMVPKKVDRDALREQMARDLEKQREAARRLSDEKAKRRLAQMGYPATDAEFAAAQNKARKRYTEAGQPVPADPDQETVINRTAIGIVMDQKQREYSRR